jgi:large subunit ribosomal protein L23
MMIAELVKPFVWPDPPVEEDRDQFDYDTFKKMEESREKQTKKQMEPANIPLRTRGSIPEHRQALKKQAAEFMESGEWSNGQPGEGKWTEVEKEVDV